MPQESKEFLGDVLSHSSRHSLLGLLKIRNQPRTLGTTRGSISTSPFDISEPLGWDGACVHEL